MKSKNKHVRMLIAMLIILLPLSVNNVLFASETRNNQVPEGFVKASDSGNLELYYNEEENGIGVWIKSEEIWWSTIADKEKYGLTGISPMLKSNLDSILGITYTDINANEGKLNKVYSSLEKKTVSTKPLLNGISIDYKFTLLKIDISVEITVENDSLIVRLPSDKISEDGRNLLMSLEVLPGFGAANHLDDGYILYPDGCGSLLRFENYNNRPNNLTTLNWNIYGPGMSTINNFYTVSGENSLTISADSGYASLPVFGLKKDDQAYVAYITEGAADASINVSPEGHILPLNRVAFDCKYRNTFDIILSNISVGKDTSQIKKGTKVDKIINSQDFEINYKFLSGNQANYSGMANSYRDHLKDKRLLNTVDIDGIPLALDLFCGILEKRLLFNKFIPMTTFDNAQDIIGKFLDKDVTDLHVTIKGWSKNGYGKYPVSWPIERRLGGQKGMERLVDFAGTNNVSLFAQANVMLAAVENKQFSQRTDIVYLGNGLPFSDFINSKFILNTNTIGRRIKDLLTSFWRKMDIGVSIESAGKYTFYDYSEDQYKSRVDTSEKWDEIMNEIKLGEQALNVEGGNLYALKHADRLYNIPIKSSNTNLNDEEVPFYQMIVHGNIPYTSNTGNLFYDEEYQKLKWIEFGCMPYYELTYKQANKMKYTDYKELFSSYYMYWLDKASKTYHEFNSGLQNIADAEILEHTKIENDIVRMTYSNGKKVYINYGDDTAKTDGVTIPGKGYILK